MEPVPQLSPSEVLILQMIADGKMPKEIAQIKYLSYHTIRSHIRSIHRKTGMGYMPAIIAWAMRYNIIE